MVAERPRDTPLARRIRQAIAKTGRSHAEIAEEVGIARAQLTMYCSGSRAPGRATAVALAKVLGVSVSWLLDGAHVITVQDDRLADLLTRLHDAPPAIQDAVATLLPPRPTAA
jgi:transcriptional regulator with XRE-family HTH domain